MENSSGSSIVNTDPLKPHGSKNFDASPRTVMIKLSSPFGNVYAPSSLVSVQKFIDEEAAKFSARVLLKAEYNAMDNLYCQFSDNNDATAGTITPVILVEYYCSFGFPQEMANRLVTNIHENVIKPQIGPCQFQYMIQFDVIMDTNTLRLSIQSDHNIDGDTEEK